MQLRPLFHLEVLSRFKKSIFGPGEEESNALALINLPAYMARRDAAYDRAVALLKECKFDTAEERRASVYAAIIKLLNEAAESSRLSGLGSLREEEDALRQYFLLLVNTLHAASSLLNHELTIFNEENILAGFIGRDNLDRQFKSADDIFSAGELNLFHSVRDIMEIAGEKITKLREQAKKQLPKGSLIRYDKAYSEHRKIYGQINPGAEPAVQPAAPEAAAAAKK
jgi:hypothetical protein